MPRCAAKTLTGKRCKRSVSDCYCAQHMAMAKIVAAPAVVVAVPAPAAPAPVPAAPVPVPDPVPAPVTTPVVRKVPAVLTTPSAKAWLDDMGDHYISDMEDVFSDADFLYKCVGDWRNANDYAKLDMEQRLEWDLDNDAQSFDGWFDDRKRDYDSDDDSDDDSDNSDDDEDSDDSDYAEHWTLGVDYAEERKDKIRDKHEKLANALSEYICGAFLDATMAKVNFTKPMPLIASDDSDSLENTYVNFYNAVLKSPKSF